MNSGNRAGPSLQSRSTLLIAGGGRATRRTLVAGLILSWLLTPHVLSWFTDPLQVLPWLFGPWLLVFATAARAGRALRTEDRGLRMRTRRIVSRVLVAILVCLLALAALVARGDARLWAPLVLLVLQVLVLAFRLPALVSLWIAPVERRQGGAVAPVPIEG